MTQIDKNHAVGVIGLGKMGSGIALQLTEKGWIVHGYNRTKSVTEDHAKQGIAPFFSLEELVESLPKPRILWVMLTAGDPTEEIILGKEGLVNFIERDDIIIDAANSNFNDSKRRSEILNSKGIKFVDAGVSGGPGGARSGACVMVGGNEEDFNYLEPLFKSVSLTNGYQYFGKAGAGHFVKMVHNGIEYGMMQAIGEGFEVMKKSEFNLNLAKVANLYNHGSVIESRLIKWLEEGYEKYGENLDGVSGSISHSGEGLWTVETAKVMNIPVPIIEKSLKFRVESQKKPSYTGKVVSVLRNMFGRHDVSEK